MSKVQRLITETFEYTHNFNAIIIFTFELCTNNNKKKPLGGKSHIHINEHHDITGPYWGWWWQKHDWLWLYTGLPHASAMNECSLERQNIHPVYWSCMSRLYKLVASNKKTFSFSSQSQINIYWSAERWQTWKERNM